MTQSLPSFSGTQGSAAIAQVLESIRDELLPELDALRTVFQEEVAPRAKRIGDHLIRAQGQFARNIDFYDWADTAVGLKQRQIRNYIRFTQRLAAINAAAEDQEVPISSIEQGLALLTPVKEEDTRTEEELKVAAVAQATGRAKGAIARAMDTIYEISPGGLSQDEVRLFQELSDLLTRWGSTTSAPEAAIDVTPAPQLAVNSQPVSEDQWPEESAEAEDFSIEPTTDANPGRSRLLAANLPVDDKPGKWSLSELEEGLALMDGNQSKLAEAIGVTKAAISNNLKKKREKAGLSDD